VNRLRRLFGGSKANRDRRDQAFARSVIAEAERRRRAGEMQGKSPLEAAYEKIAEMPQTLAQEAQETLDAATCEHCGRATCLGDCPQYYESLRDEQDEWNADE
jgi:Fe-S-cluster-containing dehydrogenase component